MKLYSTKRFIVITLGITALSTLGGWMYGAIEPKDAQIIIMAIVTPFCALLKGGE